MPAEPVISVLIPSWNAEATIAGAIASVLEARSAELECIVVDDASTDETVAVVRRVASGDPRVVLLPLEGNEGVSNARNRGLELVRGTWLTLLDADDRFSPGGLDALIAAAHGSDALAVIGQQVWSDGTRTWTGPLYDIPDIRQPGRKSLATHPGLVYFVSPHAKLLHRSTWEGLTFTGRVLGDQAWIIRALLRAGDRIDVLGDTTYEWFKPSAEAGGSSITTRTRSSAARGVEAATVAVHAFEAVAEDAARLLAPAGRDAVLDRYVERLLRSDLGAHLGNALGRGDPTIDQLLAAIEGFLRAVPVRHVRASDALALDIVEPPLVRWHRVNAAGRRAWWGLAGAARSLDPKLRSHLSTRRAPIALALGGVDPSPLRRAAADVFLFVARAAAGVWRRLRR